ncbi:hypothetical protein Agub_g8168, partial [Astrephomene gubernaculifera]
MAPNSSPGLPKPSKSSKSSKRPAAAQETSDPARGLPVPLPDVDSLKRPRLKESEEGVRQIPPAMLLPASEAAAGFLCRTEAEPGPQAPTEERGQVVGCGSVEYVLHGRGDGSAVASLRPLAAPTAPRAASPGAAPARQRKKHKGSSSKRRHREAAAAASAAAPVPPPGAAGARVELAAALQTGVGPGLEQLPALVAQPERQQAAAAARACQVGEGGSGAPRVKEGQCPQAPPPAAPPALAALAGQATTADVMARSWEPLHAASASDPLLPHQPPPSQHPHPRPGGGGAGGAGGPPQGGESSAGAAPVLPDSQPDSNCSDQTRVVPAGAAAGASAEPAGSLQEEGREGRAGGEGPAVDRGGGRGGQRQAGQRAEKVLSLPQQGRRGMVGPLGRSGGEATTQRSPCKPAPNRSSAPAELTRPQAHDAAAGGAGVTPGSVPPAPPPPAPPATKQAGGPTEGSAAGGAITQQQQAATPKPSPPRPVPPAAAPSPRALGSAESGAAGVAGRQEPGPPHAAAPAAVLQSAPAPAAAAAPAPADPQLPGGVPGRDCRPQAADCPPPAPREHKKRGKHKKSKQRSRGGGAADGATDEPPRALPAPDQPPPPEPPASRKSPCRTASRRRRRAATAAPSGSAGALALRHVPLSPGYEVRPNEVAAVKRKLAAAACGLAGAAGGGGAQVVKRKGEAEADSPRRRLFRSFLEQRGDPGSSMQAPPPLPPQPAEDELAAEWCEPELEPHYQDGAWRPFSAADDVVPPLLLAPPCPAGAQAAGAAAQRPTGREHPVDTPGGGILLRLVNAAIASRSGAHVAAPAAPHRPPAPGVTATAAASQPTQPAAKDTPPAPASDAAAATAAAAAAGPLLKSAAAQVSEPARAPPPAAAPATVRSDPAPAPAAEPQCGPSTTAAPVPYGGCVRHPAPQHAAEGAAAAEAAAATAAPGTTTAPCAAQPPQPPQPSQRDVAEGEGCKGGPGDLQEGEEAADAPASQPDSRCSGGPEVSLAVWVRSEPGGGGAAWGSWRGGECDVG